MDGEGNRGRDIERDSQQTLEYVDLIPNQIKGRKIREEIVYGKGEEAEEEWGGGCGGGTRRLMRNGEGDQVLLGSQGVWAMGNGVREGKGEREGKGGKIEGRVYGTNMVGLMRFQNENLLSN